MSKTELRIGRGYLTNVIYIGKVRTYKDGHQEWTDDRKEVTKQAVAAVIEHIRAMEREDGQAYRVPIDGEVYELRLVKVKEEEE